MPPQLAALSCDQDATPISNLGGCVIVTKTDVFQCRQILSPEDIFLQLVLSSKSHEMAEEFGITYRLDICGLYLEAAKTMLKEQRYSQALKLFELSHVRERGEERGRGEGREEGKERREGKRERGKEGEEGKVG